jgi:hypothetical protein
LLIAPYDRNAVELISESQVTEPECERVKILIITGHVTVTLFLLAMTIKLKRASKSPPSQSWGDLTTPSPPPNVSSLPSLPVSWLSARDMKLFGVQPLSSTSQIGIVKCKDCDKPVLRSFMAEHGCLSTSAFKEAFDLTLSQ